MLFICYRREDTGGDAGRLNDTLHQLLGSGSTFFDFESIGLGRDFEVELESALSKTQFLLALMGPKWDTIADASGKPRLYDENDVVRAELLAAMRNNVRIVPILLNRYTMVNTKDLPEVLRPLTKLQAFEIRRDRWKEDISTLLERLGIPLDPDEDRQARRVSASVEWKRKDQPDPTPRRWVVYIDNYSDAPITVKQVRVISKSLELPIEDWGMVAPKASSDYELEESDFHPQDDRPNVYVRFMDAGGRRWSLRRGALKRLRREPGVRSQPESSQSA